MDLILSGMIGASNRETLYAEDYKYFVLLRRWFCNIYAYRGILHRMICNSTKIDCILQSGLF